MSDDSGSQENVPYRTANQDLWRLCQLLAIPVPSELAQALTLADFAGWKARIERAAFEQHPNAVEMADLAERVARATGSELCLALALWISGNVYFVLDQPLAAIRRFDAAEGLYRAYGDELSVARLSVGKISALDKSGRYEEAIACGMRVAPVLAASDDQADQRRLVGVHNGIGISSEHLGRYLEALDSYREKWRWWQRQLGEAAQIQTARALVNMGVVQTRLGQYLEALDAFDRARSALVQAQPSSQTLSDIARVDMNVAWLEVVRRRAPDIVQTAFDRARASRSATPDASTDLVLLDLFEAEWRAHLGLWRADDLASLQSLHQRCAGGGLAIETARAELLLARWLLHSGNPLKAQQTCAQVIAAARQRGDVEIAYLGYLDQAQAYRLHGDLPAARTALEAALTLVEQTRHRLVVDEFRAGYLEDKLAAYHELTSLWLETGDARQAFQIVERAKARTLVELLQAKPDQLDANVSTIAEVQALEAELQRLRSELTQPTAAHSAASQRAIEKQITELTRRMAQVAPRYAPVPSTDNFHPEDVAAQLAADTLAIAYAVLHDQVWAFLLDANGLLGEPLLLGVPPEQNELRLDLARINSIGRLPRASAERWLDQQTRTAQAPLARWYQQYCAPLSGILDRYEKLLIAPDGLLNVLPFAAFYDERTGRYVAQDHVVTTTPSLATWRLINSQSNKHGKGACAVGYSSNGRLPHAAEEARRVATTLPQTALLLEKGATRRAFAQCASKADLVILATHGVYRSDVPAFSYLELADGRLEAFDIFKLNLQASAVVLSACETAAGHITGNELMGLARAFLYAGARSVVATYWPVDDEAMAALMDELLSRLLAGHSLAQALATAQQAFIKRATLEASQRWLAHPFFWGPLAVIGVDGPMSMSKD